MFARITVSHKCERGREGASSQGNSHAAELTDLNGLTLSLKLWKTVITAEHQMPASLVLTTFQPPHMNSQINKEVLP